MQQTDAQRCFNTFNTQAHVNEFFIIFLFASPIATVLGRASEPYSFRATIKKKINIVLQYPPRCQGESEKRADFSYLYSSLARMG
jgi:hypothetical protein